MLITCTHFSQLPRKFILIRSLMCVVFLGLSTFVCAEEQLINVTNTQSINIGSDHSSARTPSPSPAGFTSIGDQLVAGQSLKPGQMIHTDYGKSFRFSKNGKLGLYEASGRLIWEPNLKGKKAYKLTMRLNGNLMAYDKNQKTIWESNTWHIGSSLRIGPELSIVDDKNKAVWETHRDGSIWRSEEDYIVGEQIQWSGQLEKHWKLKRGEINLVMQANGNLVLRNDEGKVFWSTNTEGKDGYTAIFNEGNLAVYRGGGSIIWETGTGGHPKARLQIHGEGDFAGIRIIDQKGKVIWEKGNGFKRVYRLQWNDLIVTRYNELARVPSQFLYGSVVITPPFGVMKTTGHAGTFWKKDSTHRIKLQEGQRYNADIPDLYGYPGQYKGQFFDKFQEYTIVQGIDGDYPGLDKMQVGIMINLFDWNPVIKNQLVQSKMPFFKLKDFTDKKDVIVNVFLDNHWYTISTDFVFQMYRVR